MKYNLYGIGILFFIMMIVIVNIEFQDLDQSENLNISEDVSQPIEAVSPQRPKALDPVDKAIDLTIYPMYVTVFDSKPIESVTIDDINQKDYSQDASYVSDQKDDFAYIQFATEPTWVLIPNGTIEIRGQSARLSEQKSYKIKLFQSTDNWLGYDILNLNKHFEDLTRLKNKLSFDLFYQIANIPSMETKFVELFIKDTTKTPQAYKSYGLFTFIEQANEDFMFDMYGDSFGTIYKAENFEFDNYDVLVSKNHPSYDEAAFEERLEIRSGDDHVKLKTMLEALNDYNTDIDEIVNQYFDEENMLTWLACNILMNNYDTSSRNFMIYNPTHSQKWYFLPWDYDKAWTLEVRKIQWQQGISNYWNMVLFSRYFKKPANFQKFEQVFESVYAQLQVEKLDRMVSDYANVTNAFIQRYPDNFFIEDYDDVMAEIAAVKYVPVFQYKHYYENIDTPMPFFLGEPVRDEEGLFFTWDPAYDLQNDPLSYTLTISQDPFFRELVYVEDEIFITSHRVEGLTDGTYYWKVVARDDKNNTQMAFDIAITEDLYLPGVKILKVGDQGE